MNINLLFEAGMRTCGRVLKVLPKDDIGSPLIYMQKILKEETLPSLDILLPRFLTKTFPIYALEKVQDGNQILSAGSIPNVDNRYNVYRIPSSIVEGAGIMGIRDCFPSYGSNDEGMSDYNGIGLGEIYPNRYGRFSSANLYAKALSSTLQYADAQLVGTIMPQLRYKFFQPNIMWINKPWADNEKTFITVTFKLRNDENLVTVPDSAFEGIKKLFILDLKKSIYNEYSMFSELETPYGTVNLRIDDWNGAEADRDTLYTEYLGQSHFRNSSMRTG